MCPKNVWYLQMDNMFILKMFEHSFTALKTN